jgi:hypothetical protein
LWSVLPISHITQWLNNTTTEERLIIRDNLIEYFCFLIRLGYAERDLMDSDFCGIHKMISKFWDLADIIF